ncbi:putative transporter [Cyphellophora attinorum]|uniref:Putative transporter n=1 Tax=Cyphellophora attinorum TaxID=1664694 RepID=A0A0N1H6D3_9EURO|nr:putative transporter [Phialophora attinorum]KPI37705.1 putative transporter [Phialophora attinorum]
MAANANSSSPAEARPSTPQPARRSSMDKEADVEVVESIQAANEELWLQQYDLLAGKSKQELAALNKKVVKKLDWRFLTTITMMLLMNYLDRINVSNARLAGMQEDFHMSDVEWSAGISLFYVGYIISQVPANVIIAKGKPRVLLPTVMLGWSVLTISMPAVKSAWGFMLCRFLVGVFEGPFVPGVALLTSSWYTKEESPLRMGIWHAGNIISNVISGFLAAGILEHMDNIAGLHAWQWFFLIEGIVSILVAVVGFWGLPNWPDNTGTYFFTPEESQMAQYRVKVSAGGHSEDDEGGYWSGFALAMRDPFTWMFAGMHFGLVTAQSFKDFFPSVVATLGFTKMQTYLVQAPPYIIAYFVTLAVSWSSGRRGEACWHIVSCILACMLGAVLLISTLNVGARYFGLILLCSGPFLGLNLQLSWETTVVPRPRTKRAALVAFANCVSAVSHWFSPYFFLRSQEPRYQTGGGIIIVGCGLTVIFCLMVRWWAMRKNKAIVKEEERTGVANPWRFAT